MNYIMYATAKNKLYSIYTDITRSENKENVLVDILFRVEELDENNEDTKVVKELKNMYVYDPGLTNHQINDGVASMYTTSIKIDANVEDEKEIKWHHMKGAAVNELIRYVKESEEKTKEDEDKWPMIDDVILNDDVKHQITQVIKFIKDKDKYIKMGCRIPHGYLLCGHSGTGKTLIAKAIANECDVDIMQYSGSAFTERYVRSSTEESERYV